MSSPVDNISKIYNSKFFDTTMASLSFFKPFKVSDFRGDIYDVGAPTEEDKDLYWRFEALNDLKFQQPKISCDPTKNNPLSIAESRDGNTREFKLSFYEDDNLTVFKRFSAFGRAFSDGRGLISKGHDGRAMGFHFALNLYRSSSDAATPEDTFNDDQESLLEFFGRLSFGTVLVTNVTPPFSTLSTAGTPNVPKTTVSCLAAKCVLELSGFKTKAGEEVDVLSPKGPLRAKSYDYWNGVGDPQTPYLLIFGRPNDGLIKDTVKRDDNKIPKPA